MSPDRCLRLTAGGLPGESPPRTAHPVLTAALKLADIAARSLFVLLALFSLPARETGQFGLLLTLIGFFAFGVGYERHPDLQRNLARLDPAHADQLVFSTLRLYAAHYLVAIPVLTALLVGWVDLPPSLAAAVVVIAVGEHMANEAYRLAVVLPRFRILMTVGLAKNLVLLAGGASLWWWGGRALQLPTALLAWAVLSLLSLAVLVAACRRRIPGRGGSVTPLATQWRVSRTHFLIGLVAILSLQADRLVAGSFLGLETAGIYFRHVFLASVAYQALGVLSFNRVLPAVYRRLAAGDDTGARLILRREKRIVVPLCLTIAGATSTLALLDASRWSILKKVVPVYLALLVLSFLIRGLADYNTLLLNGAYHERDVFRSQLTAMTVSIIAGVFAAQHFGLPGLLLTTLLGSILYLIFSGFFCDKILPASNP